jgi:hypothetical protein
MESVILWVCMAFVLIVFAILLAQDWPFITRPLSRTEAEVIRHDKSFSDGDDVYSAVFAFVDEVGTAHEVRDNVLYALARPRIGTRVTLTYPQGAAHKARPQRLWLRAMIYLVMCFFILMLAGRLLGWLDSSGEFQLL